MYEKLVKRKAVLNTLNRMDKALDTDRTVETYKELLEECFKVLPTVDAQPVIHAEWVHQYDDYFDWWECENCGYGSEGEMQWIKGVELRTNYCPNCGAKMDEEQDDPCFMGCDFCDKVNECMPSKEQNNDK